MNLKGRVVKLEAQSVSVEPLFVLRTIVPARDGKPYGTENGIQRIRCGDQTWLRKDGETEDEFIARARAEGTAGEMKSGALIWLFHADYGDLPG